MQGTFIFPVPSRRSGLQKNELHLRHLTCKIQGLDYEIDPIIDFEEQALGGAVLTNPRLYFRYRSQLATSTPPGPLGTYV